MFKPTVSANPPRVVPVPDSTATVEITYIKPGIQRTIESNSMSAASKQTNSGMNMEIGFNTDKRERDIVQACCTGWTSFTDEYGNNMKFNAKNLALMLQENGFVEWVVEEHEKIAAEIEGAEEEATKNSKS